MATRQFIMNAGRTTKQGRQINVGKDDAEYEEMVTTLIMHPDDIEDILRAGAERARALAAPVVEAARAAVGVGSPAR